MIKGLFKSKELRIQVLITLCVLLIYKIGVYIAVPGIDRDILDTVVGSSDVFTLTNLISGGAINQFSILALGLIPYITASIVIQLLSMDVVKSLTELKNQGKQGEKSLKRITIILSLILALFQGTAMAFGFNSLYSGLIKNDVWWNYALIGVLFTLGTGLLIALSKLIDKKGLGNGISVLIYGSILMSMPSAISMYVSGLELTSDLMFIEIVKSVFLAVLVFGLVVFVVFVSLTERRVPIKSTKNLKSGASKEGVNYLPFKLLSVGVIPVIFASSFVILPTSIAQYNAGTSWSNFIIEYLSLNTWGGNIVYALVIFFFTYFYTFLQLNPEKIAKSLSESETFIPGIRPGRDTEAYLRGTLKKLSFMSASVLAFISILPNILTTTLSLPSSFQIGGTSLIIAVSVGLDIYSRVSLAKKKTALNNYNSYDGVFGKRETTK